ncbi:MAG: cytochrome c [Pigmentiphaga sp.]|nr:cytochrome c [Pigmentiphaga sp.]
MMKSRVRGLSLSLAALALTQTPAMAEAPFPDAAAAVEYRQGVLKQMGEHSQSLAEVARGRAPYDPEQVKADVAEFRALAAKPWQAFHPGTEGGNARPEVWREPQKFADAAQLLQTRMAELEAAADTGELARVREAFGHTANSCRACHDSFRQRR